jgi:hypothetical protein
MAVGILASPKSATISDRKLSMSGLGNEVPRDKIVHPIWPVSLFDFNRGREIHQVDVADFHIGDMSPDLYAGNMVVRRRGHSADRTGRHQTSIAVFKRGIVVLSILRQRVPERHASFGADTKGTKQPLTASRTLTTIAPMAYSIQSIVLGRFPSGPPGSYS